MDDLSGVDDYDEISVLIDIMDTQDNGGAHQLYINDIVQLPLTTHEDLHLTIKYSKQTHISVHDNKSSSPCFLKRFIPKHNIGNTSRIQMNDRNKTINTSEKRFQTYSM